MSLTTDYIYQYTLNLIKKNQAGALGSVEWARHWNGESNAYQDDLLGRFQRISNGKSGINTGLIESETILQKLAPFTKNATIAIALGNGSKPSDFKYLLALRIDGRDVHHFNKNQKATVMDNVIDPPSITDGEYYYTGYQGQYSFLPTTVTSAEIDYVASPVDVVWGFIISGGRQVYNVGTSTQPQWDDASCREITKRVLSTLGISFKDGDFANFGQHIINTGN
jgi:hypothetical protein